MIPNIGSLYRFSTGIRVVLSTPMDGRVKVAQPRIRLSNDASRKDAVMLKKDSSIFTYPGVVYLDVESINCEYVLDDLIELDVDTDEAWREYRGIVLKTPVKRKRKPRAKR